PARAVEPARCSWSAGSSRARAWSGNSQFTRRGSPTLWSSARARSAGPSSTTSASGRASRSASRSGSPRASPPPRPRPPPRPSGRQPRQPPRKPRPRLPPRPSPSDHPVSAPGTRDVQTPGSGRLHPAGIDKPEAPAKAFTNRGINHLRLRFRLVNQSPANRRFTRRAGSMNCKAARKDALTPGASQLMDAEIIIVSGLPRSGTSLMMQMLASGGLKTVTDNVRTADTDNPRGYYELEKVKKIKDDA